MALGKGESLEELIRAYFQRQGYIALRAVPLVRDDLLITDIDIWLYSPQAAGARVKGVVDAKSKKSPKALERIFWARGLREYLGADRAIVVTTDANPRVAKIARECDVFIINKFAIDTIKSSGVSGSDRVTLENFEEMLIRSQPQGENWVERLSACKSALVSTSPISAFNFIIGTFAYFLEQKHVRVPHREIVTRAMLFSSALACIALDLAIQAVVFESGKERQKYLEDGIRFGDPTGRLTVQFENFLSFVRSALENGTVISSEIRKKYETGFGEIRADIVAEYFSQERNAHSLVKIAKELEQLSHTNLSFEASDLSKEARSVLGVFADFLGVNRQPVLTFSASAISGRTLI